MSIVQDTIPFKARKKVTTKSSRNICDENQDIINTLEPSKVKKLKRCRIKDDKGEFDEDFSECSGTKISGKYESNFTNSTRDELICANNFVENIIAPRPLTSRETEIEWLDKFLTEHLENKKSASVYISGQPGTGKTASLSYILQLPKIQHGYQQVYINCTTMKSAASIYNTICKELQLKQTLKTEKACLSAIEKYLNKKHKMILLVLDEIDQLESKRQSVLYSIFEWPALPGSRLVLVGIANALDLTERTLPRLQARCSLTPCTLHFAPYTKEQIISIFTTVFASEDKTNVFSPVALQMLSAKIAAVSGDMRRALDIGRRVIQLAKRNKFSDNKSVDSMMKDASVTVELKQVLDVLNDVYGSSKKMELNVDEGLPMQEKLILCSLMLILTKGKTKYIVMGKLHDVYKKVAMARNIDPLDLCELVDACSLLEARGALRVGGADTARGRRLALRWHEAELAAALRDKTLLASILSDVSCLS